MTVILDRFEEGFAVVELPDGDFVNLPRQLVPGAKEGDVITISIDEQETKERTKKIQSLMEQVFGPSDEE